MKLPLWLFPATIAALEGAAAIRYAYSGEWRLAIIWLGVCVSNFAFAGIKS